MRSLFVHDPADLKAPIPGGVQLCSQEFLEIVRAASDTTALVPVTVTRHPWWRVRRRFRLGSYLFYDPAACRAALENAAREVAPTHVFFNRSELMRLAPLVAQVAPGARAVVMSHGNQSGDDLYEASGPGGRRQAGLARLAAAWQIGLDLVTESAFRRRHLDAVCVMSDEEETLERWLGAKCTIVLPRLIRRQPLTWQPVAGRAGYVGTLSHTPNRVALTELCECLAARDARLLNLRLVGGPAEIGREFASRYPFVTFLGALDDAGLRAEAATWSVFLNPIFWLARGASMKLGQALGWGLPCLSTTAGSRGYRLAGGEVCLAPSEPDRFAHELLELLGQPNRLQAVRDAILTAADAWPTATTLARELRARLS